MLFPEKRKSMNWLAIVVALLTIVAIVLIALKPEVPAPFTGEPTDYSGFMYVVLIGGVLSLLAFFLMKFLGEDTAAICLWGALAILILSVNLGWLDPIGFTPFTKDPIANLRTMILGGVLMVYSYFAPGALAMWLIGLGLTVALYFFKD